MSKYALEWKNVTFSVRQGFWMRSRKILHGINIKVPRGTVLGLVGPNGAGKTTTIKLGAGLLVPDAGQVMIKDSPASLPQAKKCLGFLTESQYIYPHLRLREWLLMLGGFSGLSGDRLVQRTETVLELAELLPQADQMMNTLSKGQLQRAGIAQSLVHDPDILLLDEPMSGLDPYWRHRIQSVLLDYKASGRTILFSSHILSDVERLSDRVVFLEKGQVQWEGRLCDMPRKITGYEMICETDQAELFEKFVKDKSDIIRQPEGNWRIMIPEDRKKDFLHTADTHSFNIISLRPVQEEIAEVLFRFRNSAE